LRDMKRTLSAVLGVALLTAGCADPIVPASPTPVLATISESFNDTLLVLGTNSHPFTVQQIGGLKVSISTATPTVAIGLALGTPSIGSCAVIERITVVPNAQEPPAVPAVHLSGNASVAGPFCVLVYDVGNLTEPITYTVNVLHS
jgi:hypothetical protein